jgi:hypothetical protein
MNTSTFARSAEEAQQQHDAVSKPRSIRDLKVSRAWRRGGYDDVDDSGAARPVALASVRAGAFLSWL